ncbi:phage tail protein [Mesorhizobium sp. M0590]|uniref:phage tail protein n=1 Tax=Mesorhizobium sp. M0590 TaxID=2956966 RepID=UPI00333A80C6
MSAQKVYRFAANKQWDLCLIRGLRADGEGLVPVQPLGPHAAAVGSLGALSTVASDPYDNPVWRFVPSNASGQGGDIGWMDESDQISGPDWIDEIVEASPRLVLDRHRAWAFDARTLRRYDRETFQSARTITLDELHRLDEPALIAIVDIAPDGKDGIWLLVATADRHELLHLDCRDCLVSRRTVSNAAGVPGQIGILGRGTTIVLLSTRGERLSFVCAKTGSVMRDLSMEQLSPGWTATRLATDGRGRIGLGCEQEDESKWQFLLLDAAGELLQPAFEDLFRDAAAPRVDLVPSDFALGPATVWFATKRGLWRLAGAEETAATTAWLMTPRLMSPVGERRGWSRAELMMDLPEGVSIEVSYASTDDANLAGQVLAVSNDTGLTVAQRHELIWRLLDDGDTLNRTFAMAGPAGKGGPIAVPLFGTQDQWFWLRLRLDVPASARSPRLTELRVLYPEISLMERLPAMFNGPDNDPGGVLRRLVGVIETTTQGIDAAVRNIGRQLDAIHAPDAWLDYLGRWFDLPWHDALPSETKRALLGVTGALVNQRGTRDGLATLLEHLLGKNAIIEITDMTVDYTPMRLGGPRTKGAAIPALLAGRRGADLKLGRKATVGSLRLPCAAPDDNPLATIVPTLRISVDAPMNTKRALAPLLPVVLEQFVPLGLRIAIRWTALPNTMFGEDGNLVLDAEGPGGLGENSVIGRTTLAGWAEGRITDSGFEMGLRQRQARPGKGEGRHA